jgi:hypothetical protein
MASLTSGAGGVTTGESATNTAVDELKKQVNAASAAIGLDKVLNQAGDVKGFFELTALFAVGIVVIGFVGATVINITRMKPDEIDDLFPTNLQDFPYEVPIGKKNPGGNSIADLYSQFHADQNTERLTRATLEFVYPMKRQSFPYTSWFLKEEFKSTKGYTIAQWFAATCAGTFCAWRHINKIIIMLGKWFYAALGTIADYFLFYVFPVVAIYLIVLPLVPVIGFILAILSSTMYNIPGAWIFTFAPIMGFLLAIANIYTGGLINFFAWVMSFLIFIFGFVMGFINLVWWVMIALALWAYVIMFLLLSPLLHKGGFKNVVTEFKKKKKSLSFIFVVLVLIFAFMHLNDSLKIGFGAGALLCMYLIFKPSGDKPKEPGAPATDAAKA